MQPTTLRGVFPERRPPPRRNFIKENVKRIRQMHDVTRQSSSDSKVLERPDGKVQSSKDGCNGGSRPRLLDADRTKASPQRRPGVQRLEIKAAATRRNDAVVKSSAPEKEEKITHRSMQTEASDNMEVIYSTGTVKFPRQSVVAAIQKNRKQSQRRTNNGSPGGGDAGEKIDYIRRNMQNLAVNREKTKDSPPDAGKAPPGYKKGVVPKYIKQRKESDADDVGDIDCPPGHVLLPDEERRETLRVLRESYAEKIQELNSMPVRSDTLRQQRRKMELEAELKKIDEGIKVFQRPKVFVKINV